MILRESIRPSVRSLDPARNSSTVVTSNPVRRVAALGIALPLLLGGCTGTATSSAPGTPSPSAPDAASAEEHTGSTEAATVKPRLVISHDGGLLVLDATTLETAGEIDLPGYNRINGVGDGRHVLVSTGDGFQLLDAGTWAEEHGAHDHYYTSPPQLTKTTLAADKPGHVVPHGGLTALFDDGTGEVVVFPSDEVADPDRETRRHTTPVAHHGVAVALEDGTLVVSEGTEDARTGIRVLDADDAEVAQSDQCPGVHGEAVAADDAVVIGCEDGVLVYSDGTVTKVQSPDVYGRIGNQAGTETSAVILGDYKSDPDAELERPTQVSLIDTRTATLRLVDLPSSYTFRSLARGDHGEALVLGTDGRLHVIDPETATVVRSVPVVGAWEEPEEWQSPRPTVHVLDGTAYITDPAAKMLYAVDVETGEIWNSVELPVTPDEMVGVTGAGVVHHEHTHDEEHDELGSED